MTLFDVIAFDADDTLWHSETLYSGVQERFMHLLAPYNGSGQLDERMHQIEIDNLRYYGYGIKGFVLSLIESAIEISGGKIAGAVIQQVIDLGKEMVNAEVRLLEHAQETVVTLARSYPLMLITKGDLFDQEIKIERSGLGQHFQYIEIVSDKTRDRYEAILAKHHLDPARFVMVGNSLRSDILPVVELGGQAVYIPYHITWAHEDAPPPSEVRDKYYELEHLGLLPALIERLSRSAG